INGDPEELIAEINERNSKVNNVMVYKLNESNNQILNDRILHDKAEVVKILDMIDIKEDAIEKRTHLKRVLGKWEQSEKDGEKNLHVKFMKGIPTNRKKK
ncbi:hypothetical protein HHI36_009695, partial [Cryptolaemus montrouzieri]